MNNMNTLTNATKALQASYASGLITVISITIGLVSQGGF